MHQRAQGLVGWGQQPRSGLCEGSSGHDGLTRILDRTGGELHCSAGQRLATAHRTLAREDRTVDDPTCHPQDITGWLLRHGPEVGCRGAREVEQAGCHRHPPDAVGDGVVQLDDDRGPLAVPALHEGHLPQWPVPVEVLLAHLLGDPHERPVRAISGDVEPLEMEGEVEVGIELPARRDGRHRIADHTLAELGNGQRHPGDPVDHQVDLGLLIEDRHGNDDRAQDRVLLHPPHHRIERAHPVEPVLGHPISSRVPVYEARLAGQAHRRSCPEHQEGPGRTSRALLHGGAEGTRTPDPLVANEVRYQLRYSPLSPPRVPRPHVDNQTPAEPHTKASRRAREFATR